MRATEKESCSGHKYYLQIYSGPLPNVNSQISSTNNKLLFIEEIDNPLFLSESCPQEILIDGVVMGYGKASFARISDENNCLFQLQIGAANDPRPVDFRIDNINLKFGESLRIELKLSFT